VQQHEVALRGYLRSRFPSLDVDDVVQESYLKLLRARAAGRIASTKAYLFSIARNTALTLFHRRRIYSDTPVSELPDWRVIDGGHNAAQAFVARERFELMSQAIAQLPDRCRDVMRLAVLRGCSNAEIAAALGLAENTVRVHLARGIKKCADFLRERGERP
jgi:RNA polymerase sigma-70 factor (ECF subfamily)